MALFGFAGSGNDIRIRFLADTSNVTQATGELGNGISKGLGLASVGWAAAGAAAVGFAKQSVDAAMQAEDAQNRLTSSYQRFGAVHDVTLKSLEDLSHATQDKTRFDHLAAEQAEINLAQFNLTGKQIEQLLPLVTDFAAKTGKDLPTAATAVGKALLGNTRALKEIGITYKSTGDAATDYNNIVALLTAKVGGAAAADAETTAGKLAMLKNRYAELKEQFGAALLPLISALAPALIKILDVLTMSLQGWGLAFQWVGDHGSLLAEILENLVGGPLLWLILNTNIVNDVLGIMGNVIGWVVGAWNGFYAAISWVWARLADLWGIVVSVADAVGGFFAGAFHAAEGAVNSVVHAVEWLIDKLHALQGVWNAVSGFIGRLGSIVGLAAGPAVPSYGTQAAPTLAPALFGAGPRVAGGSSGGGGLVVNVNVHGNVGDPNLIGRRTVEALNTYVRTNGSRALRNGLGIA